MKHIKKKYLFQAEKDSTKLTESQKVSMEDPNLLEKSKNNALFIETTDSQIIQAMTFNINGRTAIMGLPDLTLVYFDMAYSLNVQRKEVENQLFQKITNWNEVDEDATNEIYRYYGLASSCIIQQFTAIESFINFILPDNQFYQKVLKTKTEIYSKPQIQKSISFREKVNDVLPFFYSGKNYFKKQTPRNQRLWNLKELRDEIVHTKSEIHFRDQEKLIKAVLNFDYDNTIEAISHFMNFYKSNYVVECNCGVDY